ncbi:MAG TPA: histidine phosphatase family protein [Phycisphaerae bacterium]|jgi:broad specificity phosphatase PhoE
MPAQLPSNSPTNSPQFPARLWLIRHGQTDWNAQGRIQGQTSTQLNAQGIAEAQTLAKVLAATHRPFAVCYTSDLPRAAGTAEIIGAALAVPVLPDPGLRERHFGAYEGRFAKDLRETRIAAGVNPHDLADWTGMPDVESNDALWSRASASLLQISARHPDQDILIVTHGGIIARAVYQTLAIPDTAPRRFPLSNGIVAILQFSASHWNLIALADLPFLSGLPLNQDTATTKTAD